MNAAGIDVSKGKSMVSVRRPFNEIAAKPFEVRHTGSELKQLADYLKSLDGETRAVIEHTGRYYEQIVQYLHDAGLYVSAVNPKLIKDYGSGNPLFDSPVREDGTQKWVDLGVSFWHVDCVRGMNQTAFVQRYTKWCKQHRYQARAGRAEEIYEHFQRPDCHAAQGCHNQAVGAAGH